MPANYYPGRASFGLLPEPEGRSASFITSTVINLTILAVALYVGMMAKHVIEQHQFEQTELIFPTTPPPQPKVKVPPPPKLPPPPKPQQVKLEAPKINLPKPEPKPALKPIQMEAKLTVPVVKAAKPAIILAPQPKAALTAAAPAQVPQAKPSTAPVHFGQTFGVTPNPNATKPATVAAIGNPYGGMTGPAVAPRGVVGSTGIGNGTRSGSNAGTVGRVASAGVPGATGSSGTYQSGKVGVGQLAADDEGSGSADGSSGAGFNKSGSAFEAAGAIHERSPPIEGAGRRDPARYLYSRGTGGGGWNRARAGTRARRRSAARGTANPLQACDPEWASGGPDDEYHHYVPVGLTKLRQATAMDGPRLSTGRQEPGIDE